MTADGHVDTLADFESERADLEEGGDDEPSIGTYGVGGGGVDVELDTSDAEPDHDEEYDFPRERQKYIKDRQQPGRGHIWQGGRFVASPGYDRTRDDEELRKVKSQLSALAAKKRKRVRQRLAEEARS